MFETVKKALTEHIGLKLTALALALVLWFYIVNELNTGANEEKQFLNKVLPSESVMAKKLPIKPILVGKTRYGYVVDARKAVASPEYVIVVGTKDLLSKIRFAYTMPVDVTGASHAVTRSVPLNPIAPGVFMEETTVQVTVPVVREH
jgi:YbbR domain-containing protein